MIKIRIESNSKKINAKLAGWLTLQLEKLTHCVTISDNILANKGAPEFMFLVDKFHDVSSQDIHVSTKHVSD